MKKYTGIFLILIGTIFASCEDFLKEDNLNSETTLTAFETVKGTESMINAAYVTLRAWYGKENGWDLTECGTDIYTRGLDVRARGFCDYSTWVGGEEQARMSAIWYELYTGINTCNTILANIDNSPLDESLKAIRKAEVSFLRAHYNWLIVETWGGVVLKTEPTTVAEYTAQRSSVDEFYNAIFSDLEYALENAPETTPDYGRITRPVVKAFLARMYLTRGDNQKALEYAEDIINNYSYSLIQNWDTLWALHNGDNEEIIWAVIYSNDAIYTQSNLIDPNSTADPKAEYNTTGLIQREGGHQGHLMWEIRYEGFSWGMSRDIANGRGFLRWMPTKFFIDLFDENADQRFYGSFKHVWYANDSTKIPKWKPRMIIDGKTELTDAAKVGKFMFKRGDTCIVFSKTPVPASKKAKFLEDDVFYFDPVKGYLIVDINDMYLPSGAPNDGVINRQYYFPITRKYMDPERLAIAQQYSGRDAFVMRISEMYLIAAEASLNLSDANSAYDYLVDLADARAINHDGAALLAGYGVSSGADIDIDFLLDERARELATENLRFFDLKRTNKLVERVKAHNTDASPYIKDFHALRFIPQTQLDAVYNKDEFKQNFGYEEN